VDVHPAVNLFSGSFLVYDSGDRETETLADRTSIFVPIKFSDLLRGDTVDFTVYRGTGLPITREENYWITEVIVDDFSIHIEVCLGSTETHKRELKELFLPEEP
jgi:hypothetical protein